MMCRVVVVLHRSYGCHVALLAMWPLYPGVKRGWREAIGSYLNKHDVAQLPCRLCYPHSCGEKFMYHQNTLKIFSHQYVDMFAVYTTQTNNQNSVAFCSCEFHYDRRGLTPWEVHKYVLRIFTFPSLTNVLQSTGFSSSQTQTRCD